MRFSNSVQQSHCYTAVYTAALHCYVSNYFQSSKMKLKEIILELESLKGIKFGSFELKNGITSPVYFDLRVIISKPKLLREISRILWEKVSNNIKPDLLCGVPYLYCSANSDFDFRSN